MIHSFGNFNTRTKRRYRRTGNPRTPGTTPSAVLFVLRTQQGALATKLKAKEKELNVVTKRSVKIVERTGTQVQILLTKSDPWGNPHCKRVECLVCLNESKEKSKCRETNTLNENTCVLCKTQGVDKKYIRETSRSTFSRGAEHLQDLTSGKETSHMKQHSAESHPELAGTLRTPA